MAGLLLESKFHVPRSRGRLVARPRLSERLRHGTESALTLVSAPAGFGKTTLLTQWLAAALDDRRSAVWLSLDQRDNEPVAVVPGETGARRPQRQSPDLVAESYEIAVGERIRVQPGQKVLVIGASGGVGTFAVQLAAAFGAQVSGVCSTAKMDLVRSLGAEHVIDYTRADITDGHPGYDVILDLAGNRPLSHLRRALTPRGTLVVVGGEGGGRWLGGTDRQIRALMLSPFVHHTLRTFVNSENGQDLAILTGLIDSGQITPVVDRTYPLAQTVAAISYMAEGRARGKVVITM